MKTPKTICTDCVFLLRTDVHGNPQWYNYLCGASPKSWIDPVTGKTITEFKYCRDVNNGNCPKYIKKLTLDK